MKISLILLVMCIYLPIAICMENDEKKFAEMLETITSKLFSEEASAGNNLSELVERAKLKAQFCARLGLSKYCTCYQVFGVEDDVDEEILNTKFLALKEQWKNEPEMLEFIDEAKKGCNNCKNLKQLHQTAQKRSDSEITVSDIEAIAVGIRDMALIAKAENIAYGEDACNIC